jgi:hypothetical protein
MSAIEKRAERNLVSTAVNVPQTMHSAAACEPRCRGFRSAVLNLCTASLVVALVAGCGSGKPAWERVQPVSGSVKLGGQPIPGAMIILVPKDKEVPDKVRPSAIADATGLFELGTYSDTDGAPEGDYDVVVTWRPLVDNGGGNMSQGPNRLPERYSRPETSQLTVHIAADDSELKPIDLVP